jgi:hypothetical protein
MIVKSCKFVEATNVFKDCPLAWDLFVNADPSCTWGDNNRSMVTPDVIFNCLEEVDMDSKSEPQVELVIKRLNDLQDNVYVDLEN